MTDQNCAYCMEGDLVAQFGIKICELPSSKVYLFKEQSHKGRVIVAHKKHVSEIVELTAEERAAYMEDIINGTPVTLTGRESYMFVDLFEFYEFDLSASAGRAIITKLNGQNAQYTAELKDGDVIELAWKEK